VAPQATSVTTHGKSVLPPEADQQDDRASDGAASGGADSTHLSAALPRQSLSAPTKKRKKRAALSAEEAEARLARRRHWRREFVGALLALFWTLVAAGLLAGIIYGAYAFWMNETPREVTVPKYVGLNEFEAKRVLDGAGLKLYVTRETYNRKRRAGTVLDGQPKAGERVRVGREVLVTVSRGEEPTAMYDFSELSLERAHDIIARHGMRLGQVAEQYHDAVPQGYICGQYPEPGQPFRRSEPINLIVSRGPQPQGEAPVAAPLPPPPASITPEEEEDTNRPSFTIKPEEEPDVTLVSRGVVVRVAIPMNGSRQEVRIVVRDADGEQTVYRKMHAPGDLIDKRIDVVRQQGTTALVRVYVGRQLLKESRV
jgi:serine/threonine-protein kinase